jgi:hypothetical protein
MTVGRWPARRRTRYDKGVAAIVRQSRSNFQAYRMALIERITTGGGGMIDLRVQTLEHCPPHATCQDRSNQWTVRIEFAYDRIWFL